MENPSEKPNKCSGPQAEQIKRLLEEVELSGGIRPSGPRDFSALSAFIFERTHSLLSATTLKRLWGYLNEEVTPRVTTLSILARTVGRLDWADWLASASGCADKPSGPVIAPNIYVPEALQPGDRIRFIWMPDRVCEAKFLADGRMEVTESRATRLIPGTTFRCGLVIEDEPLYLTDVLLPSTGDNTTQTMPAPYVCGAGHGVRFFLIDKVPSGN